MPEGLLIAVFPRIVSLPHWGRGTASAVDRVLSFIVDLRRSFPLFFIPLEPYPAPSARHLPHAGKALIQKYHFPPSNLRPFGAPPSGGRRVYPREPLPLEGAAERNEARLASFFAAKPPPLFLPGCVSGIAAFSYRSLPHWGHAIRLSGRTFLAPHRGSCPMGLCKRTGFLGVKRRKNPVRRHFERSEIRGQYHGISNIVRWPLACPYCLRHFPRRGKQVITALTISLT